MVGEVRKKGNIKENKGENWGKKRRGKEVTLNNVNDKEK